MDPILSAFDSEFAALDARSRALLAILRNDQLFLRPAGVPVSMQMFSCGEYILRSAAMVEKSFGGITTRLWDDPFEWTLPEELADVPAILKYLDEVEQTRVRGFSFFSGDGDLKREIPAPQLIMPIARILLDTIGKAAHFQGRAYAIFQMLGGQKLPRI